MSEGARRAYDLLIPGPIEQRTGGYLYARHLIDGLRAAGDTVTVHALAGRFPDADDTARAAAAAALGGSGSGTTVVIDGLALAAFADCLAQEVPRRAVLALVHHPLALETGLREAESRRFAALEARVLPLCAGVVCPSRSTAAAVAAYGVTAARIAIVPPGTVKPPHPSPPRAPHAGPLHLLSVGTVTPRKGHAVLVEALGRLTERCWDLTIIGSLTRDPAAVARVRQAIAAHGLAARVTLAGERPPEHLSDAYAAADVFVLPSFHEGYGMVFAEAMAHGLPIVATAAGAIAETVPVTAGLLVPPGDAAALAGALARIIDDAALRTRLGVGAAAAGAALPSWRETVQRWRAATQRLLS